MINRHKTATWQRKPLAAGVSVAALISAVSFPAYAQEITQQQVAAADEQVEQSSGRLAKKKDIEEVVVTGSRLKRDTFSSVSPLQVIDAEGAKDVGLINPADILQSTGAAAGQQIDLTFSGFVLDNGPGATTVDLRGLGAGRTLVLLNGRRLAPAGVEGAPSAPDLSLVPSGLVQQYDLLLDGASSIYGSDAVAGVANMILKKDFDGLEINGFSTQPEHSNGEENTLTVTWGKNWDRGFIGFGLDYFNSDSVSFDDRPWTEGCEKHREIGLDGNIYQEERFYTETLGMETTGGCLATERLVGRVSVPSAGSIYYTPGSTNGGWPNFTETDRFGIGIDTDGDGIADTSYQDYSLNGTNQGYAHLFPDQERTNVMFYGEYTFDGDMNLTPYFETLYSKRETSIRGREGQLFPSVPANNPFNLCNPNGVNGVDCGLAYDELLTNPAFAEQVRARFGGTPADFGLLVGPIGPAASTPIVSVRGDRNITNVEIEQFRFVGGLRGDLPQMNIGTLNDWTFDTYWSFSKSEGDSSRPGIRGDRLNLSLATTIEDPNNPGQFICGADNNGDGIPDGTDGCVPVNMFAPSLYVPGGVGDFATQAERDFLFDTRDFKTEYYQSIFSAFFTGNLFELPAGNVIAGIGAEIRYDRIKSIPDDVARDGLLVSFFSDGGATGSKYTRELYGEVELPLLADKFLATELTANLSARYTKDQLYGSASTYSGKIAYRPVDSLLLRATVGTSYRAPNLRENFLQAQTGFNDVFDPCLIPDAALDPISGGYNPSLDTRSPEVLANCAAQGADPTTLSNNGFNTYSVEIARGGNQNLVEETSDSYTVGFSFEQPFFDEFDLTLGMTYYDIDIDNSIIEPTGQFLVNDCYNTTTISTFCGNIRRGDNGLIEYLDAGFINRDNETARGIDINLLWKQTITMFDLPFDVSIDARFNRLIERSITFTNDEGLEDYDNDVGEFGFAEWRSNTAFRVEYGDYRFTWAVRYVGSVEQQSEDIDAFSDVFDTDGTGFTSDTCVGVANGGTDCRDVGFADNYFKHDASFYYNGDVWTIGGGIRNVFDEAPPQVDGNEVFALNNTPIGVGYDLRGRTFFFELGRKF
ncbi:TonB-dependent receptor domain-containing protein [Pseudoteredinibacter isoporae]|uniref:Iron complex outermembrane receptor protein n=1 Tax=Pseudoteredinibacter isoporae TaxID=570281 RepID=A0A7X0JYE3_9GAMM|nr:TonB-dependent receptor [Pseudoteredinibacter isoporae]MBB6523536.1 iron complex outermembrane receptor protein [Pseudoteredinibacter isoporae]NHO89045.1 TonB-dependent receptor [Pseudoteredinibacter isoporae]NIB22344.1 TonB-dependent receptor [Pseudoteredinibacter isoporae]